MFLWSQKANDKPFLPLATCLGIAGALHVITFVILHLLPEAPPPPRPPLIQTIDVRIPLRTAPKAEKTTSPPPKPVKKKKVAPKTKAKPIKSKPETLAKPQEKVKGEESKTKPKEPPTSVAKDIPKKEEPKPETKPVEQKAAAEDLLKNLAEQEEKPIEEPKPEEPPEEEFEAKDISETLTISELDAFRQQISRCWTLPIKASQNIPVQLEVTANPDGSIESITVLEPTTQPTIDIKIAVKNAKRAFDHPDCQNLSLPKERYNQWKVFRVIFQKDKGVF